jgi:hypothetical protein
MIQSILIAVLFIAALVYLGYLIYKSFTASSCTSGCGSCGVDFSQIEKQLEKNEAKK